MVRKLMAAFAAAFICGTVLAASAKLFDAADYLPASKEAASLNAEERAELARRRAQSAVWRVLHVVRVYPDAVSSGLVSIQLPGADRPIELRNRHYNLWTPAELPPDAAGPVHAFLSRTAEGSVAGSIHFRGHVYVISPLPGAKHAMIMEMENNYRLLPDEVAPKKPK